MEIEKILRDYKEGIQILPDERKVRDTVKKSISVYCLTEQERRLGYGAFLRSQLQLIQKRWWLGQLMLLLGLWIVLPSLKVEALIQRVLGVAAALFVILIVPELWKNKAVNAMEIEAASYYSLRQIYAARILLFGIVDIGLLTAFCGLAAATGAILLPQLLIQFIFPLVVTAAICFLGLCSKCPFSQTAAVMWCIGWSGVWLAVILQEKIYEAIAWPLWIGFMGIAVCFLGAAIHRALERCDQVWEVKNNGIEIG